MYYVLSGSQSPYRKMPPSSRLHMETHFTKLNKQSHCPYKHCKNQYILNHIENEKRKLCRIFFFATFANVTTAHCAMSRTCFRLTMKWSCTVIKTSSLWRHFFFLTSSHTCDGVKKSASSCQTTLGIWVRASERKNNKHIEHEASRSTNTRPINYCI